MRAGERILFSKYLYYARTDMLLVAFVVMQLWAAVQFEAAPGSLWVWIFRLGGALGLLVAWPTLTIAPMPRLLAAMLGGALAAAAFIALLGIAGRRAEIFSAAFLASLLLAIAFYQHLLSDWALRGARA